MRNNSFEKPILSQNNEKEITCTADSLITARGKGPDGARVGATTFNECTINIESKQDWQNKHNDQPRQGSPKTWECQPTDPRRTGEGCPRRKGIVPARFNFKFLLRKTVSKHDSRSVTTHGQFPANYSPLQEGLLKASRR